MRLTASRIAMVSFGRVSLHSSIIRFISPAISPMALVRVLIRSWSPNTLLPRTFLSIYPSTPTTDSPNSDTILSNPGLPGSYIRCTTLSASAWIASWFSTKYWHKYDLPVAIEPVTPNTSAMLSSFYCWIIWVETASSLARPGWKNIGISWCVSQSSNWSE